MQCGAGGRGEGRIVSGIVKDIREPDDDMTTCRGDNTTDIIILSTPDLKWSQDSWSTHLTGWEIIGNDIGKNLLQLQLLRGRCSLYDIPLSSSPVIVSSHSE